MSCGTSVLWPPDWVETPTTCTSFSTAWRATSSGVWKSVPTSTSKPRSANAVAITLAPRSWPSWPILATSMRGRRPCSPAKRSTSRLQRRPLGVVVELAAVDAGDRADLGAVAAPDLLQRVGDLADGGARARRLDRQREQVALAALGRLGQRVERGARRAAASRRRADLLEPRDLRLAHGACCRSRACRSRAPRRAGTC